MACTPWKRLHTYVDIIATGITNFQDGSYVKSGACMAMILDRYFRVFRFDVGNDLSQWIGTTDTGHIFDTDLVGSQLDQLHGHFCVIFDRVNRWVGNTQWTLGDHACFFCIFNRRGNVAYVVQPAESTGDICTLRFLYFVEKLADIGRNRAHAKSVQGTVKHVCLDTCIMEWLRPFAYGFIRIFSE